MTPIKIDLRDLDDAKVAEALPHKSKCRYTAPCIIGTLLPQDKRKFFDNEDGELDEYFPDLIEGDAVNIRNLVEKGFVEFASPEQADLAYRLQRAFDDARPDTDVFLSVLDQVRRELA